MTKSLRTPEYDILRAHLIAAREKSGLTQAEVAKRLERPQSFVAKYEGGERRLDVIEFVRVCKALSADAQSILKEVVRRF